MCERARACALGAAALPCGGHGLPPHVAAGLERGRVRGLARAREPWGAEVAELPVPRLGTRQHPVECVPRLPPLRAQKAVRSRCYAPRGVRVRRRGLSRLGAPARGLEQTRVARPPPGRRRTTDEGRSRAPRR